MRIIRQIGTGSEIFARGIRMRIIYIRPHLMAVTFKGSRRNS